MHVPVAPAHRDKRAARPRSVGGIDSPKDPATGSPLPRVVVPGGRPPLARQHPVEMMSAPVGQTEIPSVEPSMLGRGVRGVVDVPRGVLLPKPVVIPPAAMSGYGLLVLPETIRAMGPDGAHNGQGQQCGHPCRHEAAGRAGPTM